MILPSCWMHPAASPAWFCCMHCLTSVDHAVTLLAGCAHVCNEGSTAFARLQPPLECSGCLLTCHAAAHRGLRGLESALLSLNPKPQTFQEVAALAHSCTGSAARVHSNVQAAHDFTHHHQTTQYHCLSSNHCPHTLRPPWLPAPEPKPSREFP